MVRNGSAWLLLAGAIVSEVTGSVSLKGAIERPFLYVLVVLGFVTAFALLAAVLRRGMPLGVAYGVWSACGVALTAVLSSVLYGEPFTALKVTGLALVIAGVLLVEAGSRQAVDEAVPVPDRHGSR
jgi:small multidrug resistance pump